MKTRGFIKLAAVAASILAFSSAQAQTTPIKFQLDWRFEGPSALFLTPVAKGYFKTSNSMSQSTQATARAALSRVWPLAATTWALPTLPR